MFRDSDQDGALLLQDLHRLPVRRVDQRLHLRVHVLGSQLRDQRRVIIVAGAQADQAQPLAHPELTHHVPGDAGGDLDVLLRPGGGIAEDDLFGRATPHGRHHPGLQLGL